MAMLSGQQVVNTLQVRENDKVKATAYFVVGGVVQTISAWLAGEVDLEPFVWLSTGPTRTPFSFRRFR
jgi:hypothetical protein